MKLLSPAKLGLAALVSIILASHAEATVNVEFVTVGNPGNAADTTGYGAVAYEYRIAKNETTVGQYAEFLNAVAKSDPYGLYNWLMGNLSYVAGITRSGTGGSSSYFVIQGTANKPIVLTNWFDAARFCNWLHNGQGGGSTETGAYTLNGLTSGIVPKNTDARFWIPTENEWYKAAYYDPTKNGGTGGYWIYPTRSDWINGNTVGVPFSANYHDGDYVGYPGMALTDVGAYGANSASFYGTNDQGGNALEWTDAAIDTTRWLRGSTWGAGAEYLRSTIRMVAPTLDSSNVGFRIATVPEPTAIAADFRITSVLMIAGGSHLQLSWTSEPSGTYSIESSLDLTTPSWSEVATGIMSQGSSTTHTLTIIPHPSQFFRVVKRP